VGVGIDEPGGDQAPLGVEAAGVGVDDAAGQVAHGGDAAGRDGDGGVGPDGLTVKDLGGVFDEQVDVHGRRIRRGGRDAEGDHHVVGTW
jgi:hypothetical protein